MGYNPTFKLNPRQLSLIEDALHSEIARVSAEVREKGSPEALKTVRDLREVLAHLHHQKFWYRPKVNVPLG
ncbi:MAG: hypothetical protein U1E46_04405 [Hyphomicrobiales bacterium]